MKRPGFSMMELVTILIIISVLSTLAISHYRGTVERSLNQDVHHQLVLLQKGQESYRLDHPTYFASSDFNDINSTLRAFIPSNQYWNFQVFASGCVQARRNGGDNRFWSLAINSTTPAASACP